MASKNKLGVYFGINSLSIVEVTRNKIVNSFDAPHSLFDDSQQPTAQTIPDEIKLTAILQKTLRDKKIEEGDIGLALPAHEIILRSFYIPWMTSSEVKGVVDFEARRYIPFKLEELAYGFHSVTVTEKKHRRIRIVFVAIRKETLEKYCSILEQSGLSVVFAEPAPLGLLRALLLKKKISKKKRMAIVQLNNLNGTIMVIEGGVPLFFRDFKFAPSSNDFDHDADALNARLGNEIRISLDYFRRQHANNTIDQIIFLTDTQADEALKKLEQDLKMETEIISPHVLLEKEENSSIGILNALGVGLRDDVQAPVKIDLAKTRTQPSAEQTALEKAPPNYLGSFKVLVAGAIVLIIAQVSMERFVTKNTKRLSQLKSEIGLYESLTVEQIDKKKNEELEKISNYKNVRLKSNVAFFLSRIPQLLPNGTWLKKLSIAYQDLKTPGSRYAGRQKITDAPLFRVAIDLDGYAYSEDPNQQIYLVNNLIANLKADRTFSKDFEDIVLVTAQKDSVEGYTATSFRISCK